MIPLDRQVRPIEPTGRRARCPESGIATRSGYANLPRDRSASTGASALTAAVLCGASLAADATDTGGDIIVWADEATGFYGNLSARSGGDGGFAEVSAAYLEFRGTADLSAAKGTFGTLLLDPLDVIITAGNGDSSDLNGDDPDRLGDDGEPLGFFGFSGGDGDVTRIFQSEIESTNANIVIEARRSIFADGRSRRRGCLRRHVHDRLLGRGGSLRGGGGTAVGPRESVVDRPLKQRVRPEKRSDPFLF